MARFAWQLLPGIQPPYPTAFLHLQADGQQPVLISGLLDTGASITGLRGPVEQARLGVADERCIPIPALAANGAMTWQKLTMVTATLDGHDFRMPVTLSDLLPVNLIGRVGIMDLWEIRTDVDGAATEVTWIGPQPTWANTPWGDHWQTYWTDMLNVGYSWPNWNANGLPAPPAPPTLPPPLPPLAL